MRSAKSIIPKKIKALGWNRWTVNFLLCASFFILTSSKIFSQDNSPYSRYGLGDIVPNTNIVNRSMGGISAAYSDILTINFNNPASYSSFLTYMEARSKKSISGRVILDVGMNFDTRSLRELNPPSKFTVSNALFSYMQVGIPLRKNWGMSFGIRPVFFRAWVFRKFCSCRSSKARVGTGRRDHCSYDRGILCLRWMDKYQFYGGRSQTATTKYSEKPLSGRNCMYYRLFTSQPGLSLYFTC